MKSIKIIYSLFLTILLFNQADSQVIQQWASTFNGVGNTTDIPAAMVSDGLGNVIVTGRTVAGTPTSNFCTVKYNSSGVQQWAAIYNGPENNNDRALCLVADDSGNIYVAGTALNAISSHDIVLVKYNPSGIQQWVQSWTGAGYFRDMPNAMTKDAFGNIYLTGESANSTATGNNYITLKYSSGGVLQWAKQHSGGKARCIETDASGSIYVTGDLLSPSYDFLTIKYNSAGDSLWVRRYGTPSTQENVAGLALDINGNCYITGTKLTGTNDLAFLTLKYDLSGNLQWTTINDSGETAEDLEVDALGNVYITGGTNVGGSTNIATIKYNTAGIHQWIAIYNYLPEVLGDRVNDLELDGLGNIYIAGDISKVSGTDHDIITVKYNNSGVQQWVAQYDVLDQEYLSDLVLDASNNVYVTGSQESPGSADFITIKYSQTGSPLTLNLTAFIQGFYNPGLNNMINDTARVYLKNNSSPYNTIDSSKGILSSSGAGIFLFSNAVNGVNYYIAVKHRNSIETWSNSGNSFSSGTLTFNFSTVVTQAFGSNEIRVDTSPLRYAIYGGDVNQDGSIDLTDGSLVDNDAGNFVSGYVKTDVTGDNFVDVSDLTIVDNNSYNFIGIIRP